MLGRTSVARRGLSPGMPAGSPLVGCDRSRSGHGKKGRGRARRGAFYVALLSFVLLLMVVWVVLLV